MDNKVFKMVNTGACAYFLMMYSCLMFLIELWYSPKGYGILISSVFMLLMLLMGLFLFIRYRRALTNDPDNGSAAASSSVKLLGGSVILVIILQLLIRQLTMSIARFSPQVFWGILLFLLTYTPFIIIAVIKIRKGLKIKADQTFSGSIDFLCYRVILLYLFFTGIYQLMVWSQIMFTLPDYSFTSFDLYWNFTPLGSIAVALILHFAPLRINRTIKDADNSSYKYLSSQSCVTGGYLLLLTGLFNIFNLLVSDLAQLVLVFKKYGGENPYPMSTRPFVEFTPALIFLIISILIINYGKKRRS
jgi:hypothetical protein